MYKWKHFIISMEMPTSRYVLSLVLLRLDDDDEGPLMLLLVLVWEATMKFRAEKKEKINKHCKQLVNIVQIYFWPANEHYRSRCEAVIHDHHAHEAHLTVDKGVIYALRVSAFSQGGHGRKSPTMYFSTGKKQNLQKKIFLIFVSLLCFCFKCHLLWVLFTRLAWLFKYRMWF